ncbi:transglutaminase-like domain-containing protein [Sulfurovum mangrovi]|uniref:transglutaminase-like domain-containing protein n=1 Tax=Sulfurovum mangrovi TaxID=2893889 RepID=UPI001E2AB9F9|nr:transglutaminase family protein [Sulfurovum mangrovi]UFH60400.1 transglutaminase family protein [Sulfurovum mangrovi]
MDINRYLESSQYINWKEPSVSAKAKELSSKTVKDTIRSCFEFVRDEIKHSNDYKLNPVTVKASDVLLYKTGYCYAKSHLLAALLRANNIPAGLCYQRLTVNDDGTGDSFSLHGLNAVYLEDIGWYRVDPRGNKENVSADFCPPIEKLAFPIRYEGEKDLPEIWSEPLRVVTDLLNHSKTYLDVFENLPDVDLLK